MPPQRPTRLRLFLAKITRNLSFNRFQAQSANFTEPISVIANRYQMSANNVMVILSRTRKKLKAYLEKEGLYE